ncbi:hypothetical protein CXG81DRAFT_18723 [Caulochytrium protostelioides]|uniref:RWD domain-containing protein n=1 Tax=Caulochytrium protostelioides TaxID=1555241 RepID=A0A4P9X8A2_9FUNG|nr:hypothetical protein CXG81DRAFT_18723 [Caulochytrium protostelioides]|eukprot:RKP01503.1 hypothetical protein CXG81DRAFT_18723 [Caulochytrium protostelioides]
MDYEDEQVNELAALESIYLDEFRPGEPTVDPQDEGAYPRRTFEVVVNLDDITMPDAKMARPEVTLRFALPQTYPEVVPVINIAHVAQLAPKHQSALLTALRATADESVGMAMTMTIVAAAQETVERLLREEAAREAVLQREREEAREREVMKKFEGTKVTRETFTAWNTRFMAEMAAIEAKKKDAKTRADEAMRAKRPTGRQLFETDKSLASSDTGTFAPPPPPPAAAASNASEAVEVNSQLFQGLTIDSDSDSNDASAS